jgi:uncharacterized protein YdiU (UPF0061 family)
VETDMTIFYRQLAKIDCTTQLPLTDADFDAAFTYLSEAYYVPEQINPAYKTCLQDWLETYSRRIQKDNASNAERQLQMNKINPKYVLRNYLAQLAIDQAEQGDFSMIEKLLALFRQPYDEQPDKEEYAAKRPDWARQRAGCSMLSCSS